ncbi:MAG: CopG family antitoxin [Methanosarcinales archaeon]|nr:CopG family antitoxin [Methanosarcinales archaeon]
MVRKSKKMPDEFKTLEEAAEFWDTHDSTDYADVLEDVKVEVDLQKKHYLIEIDKNSAQLLQEHAREKGVSASNLASEILEKQLVKAGST